MTDKILQQNSDNQQNSIPENQSKNRIQRKQNNSPYRTREGRLGPVQARWNGQPISPVNKSHRMHTFKELGNPPVTENTKSNTTQSNAPNMIMQRQVVGEEKEKKKLLQVKSSQSTNGLPTQLKENMEAMGGVDLSDVRVNYNSSKPKTMGALAYAQGSQIEIAPGQEKHLPHEAWHTVQQKQGRVKPNNQIQGKGLPLNDDPVLEKEADVMGEKAVQMKCTSCGKEEKVNNASQMQTKSSVQFKCAECEKKEKKLAKNSSIQAKFSPGNTLQLKENNAPNVNIEEVANKLLEKYGKKSDKNTTQLKQASVIQMHSKEDCDRWYDQCGDVCRAMPNRTRTDRWNRRVCWAQCATEYAACLASSEEAIKGALTGVAIVAAIVLATADGPLPLGDAAAAWLLGLVGLSL